MEKRGVVIDEDLTKTGSTSNACPGCGNGLKEKAYCDRCGTKPFEKRPAPPPPKK